MFSNAFRKSCRLWHNVEKYCTDGQSSDNNTKRRMRIACCISKARDKTHSKYVTLIASSLQQRLGERPSILRYTYTACLCFYTFAATLLAMSR